MIRERIDVIALAGLVIALFVWLREDIKDVRQTTNDLRQAIGEQSERLARVEGMLTGLGQSVASLGAPHLTSADSPQKDP